MPVPILPLYRVTPTRFIEVSEGDTASRSVVMWRLNVGGPFIDDTGMDNWVPDSAYLTTRGQVRERPDSNVSSIVGEPDDIYKTERFGEQRFDVPIGATSGVVTVRMFFVEQFQGNWQVGARVFDIAFDDGVDNPQVVVSNLDVYRAAGMQGNRPVVVTRELFASDESPIDTLGIELTRGPSGDPMMCAVEITGPHLSPPHLMDADPGDGEVSVSWVAPFADTVEVYRDGASIGEQAAPPLVDTGLTNGTEYAWDAAAKRTGSPDVTSPRSAQVVATPTATPASGTAIGMFVTAEEVALGQARAAAGPFKVKGDAFANSPADFNRIVSNANSLRAAWQDYAWMGPTFDWPNAVINDQAWPGGNAPEGDAGRKGRKWSPEPVRDGIFQALVDTSLSAAVRDELLEKGQLAIQRSINSQYLDFTNTKRWDPKNVGNAWGAGYPIAKWVLTWLYAFDIAQAASPWSTADVEEFLVWAEALCDWYLGMRDKRRNGMWSNGQPTSAAEQAAGDPVWAGGPRAAKVNLRQDNHMQRIVMVPWMVGLLLDTEKRRSGVAPVSQSRIDELRGYGLTLIDEFLIQEPGTFAGNGSGAGTRMGMAQFYRWQSNNPNKGWKYAMEWLAGCCLIADGEARAGNTAGYDASTTDGLSGPGTAVNTTGSLPNDGVTSGGPKTLLGVTKQMLSFVDTNSTPERHGAAGGSSASTKITSTNGDNHSKCFEVLPSQVYWQDSYIDSIYRRTLAGTPDHPANPQGAHHLVEDGPNGIFPGVNFCFGLSTEDPYP